MTQSKYCGIDYQTVKVIPFSKAENFDFQYREDRLLIPYGSTKIVEFGHALKFGGCYFDPSTANVESWSSNRGADMLNHDVTIMELRYALGYVNINLSRTEMFFIRPINDLKTFAGMVTDTPDFEKWFDHEMDRWGTIDPSTVVSITSFKKIQSEYRFFVVDHQVIDGSQYRLNGKFAKKHVEVDEEPFKLAQKLAEGWMPNDVVVMDVAMTDKGAKIVEFNCFNCSGIYDHDVLKIVSEVSNYVNRN